MAYLLVMQRSHRFDRNFKEKWLCLFLKKLIAKLWKKWYCTLNRQPALLTHFPHLFFKVWLYASLLTGIFQTPWNSLRTAVVTPLLKKRNLNNTMLSNYRPISNLPFIGKIIETLVFNQLNKYLNSNGYLHNFQSGFRAHHSTATALIKIIKDIRLNSDSGKISVLVLLDLSAAFDTVDHNILLQRLENWVRLSGMVHKWFRSHLEGRGYYVSIGEH